MLGPGDLANADRIIRQLRTEQEVPVTEVQMLFGVGEDGSSYSRYRAAMELVEAELAEMGWEVEWVYRIDETRACFQVKRS